GTLLTRTSSLLGLGNDEWEPFWHRHQNAAGKASLMAYALTY
ncbi:unnamed protein product, partial [Gulo gulo]